MQARTLAAFAEPAVPKVTRACSDRGHRVRHPGASAPQWPTVAVAIAALAIGQMAVFVCVSALS